MNRTDRFVTLFEQETHKAIKNVKVTRTPPAGQRLRARTITDRQ
ncbi:hypothetical protein RSSM_05234 [Rhodopirellula sallentina SM41]|uniref:Uncharacterized protein n=1 Tax=Rhodopirellula sallentina SM41 TaxID=1263870 RepID=M5U5Y7_9BACT|nr:hypothetical protein RSSM_05234 [Rhodopirellula sallentina SM41]